MNFGGSIASSGGLVLSASLNIAAADIINGGNLKQIVPAPGANKFILPVAAMLRYRHGSQGFLNATANIYIGPANIGVYADNGTLAAAMASTIQDSETIFGNYNFGIANTQQFSLQQNQDLEVQVASGNANGNGSVTVVVFYVIVDLT